MNKTIIILASFVVVLAYIQVSQAHCRPVCSKNVPSKIICAKDGEICHKIRECTLLEENCKRHILKRPHLVSISSAACRNIKSPLGLATCSPISFKPYVIAHNCNNIRCTILSKKLNCYRSKKNNCQLLTSCQLSRVNCYRGHGNNLEWVNSHACAGMKAGQKLQTCRIVSKRG